MSQIGTQKSETVSEFYNANFYETGILMLKPINRIFVAENPLWRSKTILALKKLFMKQGPEAVVDPGEGTKAVHPSKFRSTMGCFGFFQFCMRMLQDIVQIA